MQTSPSASLSNMRGEEKNTEHRNTLLWRIIDFIWLLGLSIFVLAGVPMTTFHGDEAMQVYMSSDYATAFFDRAPERLLTAPPYDIDSDGQLRILNGSVNRYAIGLSWHLAGLTRESLPPRPGWDWGLSYAFGVETGHRPGEGLLNASRMPSALLLVTSVWLMFALGWKIGGRGTAYLASGLYVLNPVILVNGRRAMQEGALLAFGLLTVWTAVEISGRRREGHPVHLLLWALLALAAGMTLNSKHSGIVFVAGAFAWVGISELIRGWRPFLTAAIGLIVCGVLALGLMLALSPALWNDPPARFQDLLSVRQNLLDIQVAVTPGAPTTFMQRFEGIITQPFLTPAAHYEVAAWGEDPTYNAEIARYMASPLSGVQFGAILGGILTLLAGVGVIAAAVEWRKYLGLLAWLTITAATLLVNPLPWQRYYLPLIPVATLLVCFGVWWLWKKSRRAAPHG